MKNILVPFVISCFMFGCSQIPSQQNEMISTKISSLNVSSQKGADLSVNINFDFFKVKASANTNGETAKTVSDIRSVKLYLTSSQTNPLFADNVTFTSDTLVYSDGTAPVTSKIYKFSNVPAGTYYVAAKLFSDELGTENIIEPLVYDSANSGDTAYEAPGGKLGLTVSANSATVANDLSVTFSDNNSDGFDIKPKLLDAVGAKLKSSVTVTDGSDTSIGGNNISVSVESVVD